MNRSRSAFVVGAALLGLSVLSACGGAEDAPGAQSSTSQSAPAGDQAGGVKLATAKSDKFGEIVTDGAGKTLYVFDKDTTTPSKSNCDGECAAKWPPLAAGDGAPQVEGVEASLVGTVTRTDGTKQVTLNGYPLYYFAQDAKAGDTSGQAVGDVWWVVSPQGKKVTAEQSDQGSYGY